MDVDEGWKASMRDGEVLQPTELGRESLPAHSRHVPWLVGRGRQTVWVLFCQMERPSLSSNTHWLPLAFSTMAPYHGLSFLSLTPSIRLSVDRLGRLLAGWSPSPSSLCCTWRSFKKGWALPLFEVHIWSSYPWSPSFSNPLGCDNNKKIIEDPALC